MRIERLAHEIFNEFYSGTIYVNTELFRTKWEKREFLEISIRFFPESYVLKLLFHNSFLWDEMVLDDWVNIICSLRDNEIGLYTCYIFLSKFIGLDCFLLFSNINCLNDFVKENVFQYFNSRPGLLRFHSFELNEIHKHGGKSVKFFEVKRTLENELLDFFNK